MVVGIGSLLAAAAQAAAAAAPAAGATAGAAGTAAGLGAGTAAGLGAAGGTAAGLGAGAAGGTAAGLGAGGTAAAASPWAGTMLASSATPSTAAMLATPQAGSYGAYAAAEAAKAAALQKGMLYGSGAAGLSQAAPAMMGGGGAPSGGSPAINTGGGPASMPKVDAAPSFFDKAAGFGGDAMKGYMGIVDPNAPLTAGNMFGLGSNAYMNRDNPPDAAQTAVLSRVMAPRVVSRVQTIGGNSGSETDMSPVTPGIYSNKSEYNAKGPFSM